MEYLFLYNLSYHFVYSLLFSSLLKEKEKRVKVEHEEKKSRKIKQIETKSL